MKKFWKWLNGKKTVIASFYWTAGSAIILVWFPQGLPETWNKINLTIGLILTGFGLGHKLVKRVGVK